MVGRNAEHLLDELVVAVARQLPEPAPVTAAVGEPAAGREPEAPAALAAGGEVDHEGRGGAHERQRHSRILRLTERPGEGGHVEAGAPHQEGAVGRAEATPRLLHADGHAHGGRQRRAGGEEQEPAAALRREVGEEPGPGHHPVGRQHQRPSLLVAVDPSAGVGLAGAARELGHHRPFGREGGHHLALEGVAREGRDGAPGGDALG